MRGSDWLVTGVTLAHPALLPLQIIIMNLKLVLQNLSLKKGEDQY